MKMMKQTIKQMMKQNDETNDTLGNKKDHKNII